MTEKTTTRGGARTRRKPAASKAPNRRKTSPKKKGGGLLPSWRPLLLTILLLVSLGAFAYMIFLHQPQLREPPAKPEAPPAPVAEQPTPAKPPGKPAAEKKPAKAATQPAPMDDPRPLLALLIDDLGYDTAMERQALELELELTFSFIPFAPHLSEVLTTALEQDRPILLHLPLEALDDKWNKAPGLLDTEMSPMEIIAGFAEALDHVPMAPGVSNHMGSRFTADRRAMDLLMSQVARHDLFFLDTMTTADSVGAEVAADHGVPFLRRDIYLDHDREPEVVRAQLAKLLEIAKDRGWAVGLGHPYPETLEILREKEAELQENFRLVRLEQLVELHGQPQ